MYLPFSLLLYRCCYSFTHTHECTCRYSLKRSLWQYVVGLTWLPTDWCIKLESLLLVYLYQLLLYSLWLVMNYFVAFLSFLLFASRSTWNFLRFFFLCSLSTSSLSLSLSLSLYLYLSLSLYLSINLSIYLSLSVICLFCCSFSLCLSNSQAFSFRISQVERVRLGERKEGRKRSLLCSWFFTGVVVCGGVSFFAELSFSLHKFSSNKCQLKPCSD